jgi:hypothetical protein
MSAVPRYNEDLRAPVQTVIGDAPKVKVHRMEWNKVGCAHAAAAMHRGWPWSCSSWYQCVLRNNVDRLKEPIVPTPCPPPLPKLGSV